jgi:tripartite-type tricarboxylate transporter receptor subunit TctC
MSAACADHTALHYKGTERRVVNSFVFSVMSAALAVAFGMSAWTQACAGSFPGKPLRLIVAFPVGGPPDIMARILAPKLSDAFGMPVIINNIPGASGARGTETAINATADGYTVILVSASYAANAAVQKLAYDPLKDVTPLALVGEVGLVVTVQPSSTVSTIAELVAADAAAPGKLKYGSGGTGSAIHLATELLRQMAPMHLTHVPLQGSSAAIGEMLDRKIDVYLSPLPLAVAHVNAKRLRAIAVTTTKRSPLLPSVAAVGETIHGYEASQWQAFLGPKLLPKYTVARWNNEVNRALQRPEVREQLLADGVEPAAGPPEQVSRVLERDIAKWRKVAKAGGIR